MPTEAATAQTHHVQHPSVTTANQGGGPATAAAVSGTPAATASASAQTISLDGHPPAAPAVTAAGGGSWARKSNAPSVAPSSHGRRNSNGKYYRNRQPSATGAYERSKANPAPYAPHDDEVIRPLGNWDASADDAAQTPIAGANNGGLRIDLRKVRQNTKLADRFQPRHQGAPQGVIRLARTAPIQITQISELLIGSRPPKNDSSVTKSPPPTSSGTQARITPLQMSQMSDVPTENRTWSNDASDSKSPPPTPWVNQAASEPESAARPPQASTKGQDHDRKFVPPHLRPILKPAVPHLPLHQKPPGMKSARKPASASPGNSGDSNAPSARQEGAPCTAHAEPDATPTDGADGAKAANDVSPVPQPKTSVEDHLARGGEPLEDFKGKQVAKVTFHESSTPPAPGPSEPSHSAQKNGALVGGGVVPKPGIEVQHPLLGWDGTWQEAPVDWSGRPLFNTKDKYRLRALNTWMEERAQEALNNPVTVDTKVPGFKTGELLAVGEKELRGPLDSRVHETRLPDDDFTHAKKDGTAADAAKHHRARIRSAKEDTKADRRAYREAVREAAANYVPPPNPHTPRANIYIRPAIAEDMPKIAELYNHYIEHTVVASERDRMDGRHWQTRWEDAREAKYAFLVAVQASPRGGGYSRRTSEEVLAGFAYADDYGDRTGAWRFTCEIQLFVAHWQRRAGVGKSLLDRLLTALDPVYVPRGGVPFTQGDSLQYNQGGERVVSKIVIGIPFAVKEDADVKWQKEWLAQFDFEEVAIFPKFGRKLGKE